MQILLLLSIATVLQALSEKTKALSGAGSPVESASAIEMCIHPEELHEGLDWHRGVYSLRLGGAEFIKGNVQINGSQVSFLTGAMMA